MHKFYTSNFFKYQKFTPKDCESQQIQMSNNPCFCFFMPKKQIKPVCRSTKSPNDIKIINFYKISIKSTVFKLQKWHAPKNKSQLTRIFTPVITFVHQRRLQRLHLFASLVLLILWEWSHKSNPNLYSYGRTFFVLADHNLVWIKYGLYLQQISVAWFVQEKLINLKNLLN